MPRTSDVVLPDVPLHVIQRGVDGAPCFAARFGCSIHAYCLMTNHVHLLLTPHHASACGRLMKHLGQCYVQTINKSMGRRGTLWQGRFYSCVVPTDEYVLTCSRYIEMNPVRAGLVQAPEDYPWSSFRFNAGLEAAPSLSTHPSLTGMGAQAYRALFDAALPASMIAEIRKATRNGQRLGDPAKRRGRARLK